MSVNITEEKISLNKVLLDLYAEKEGISVKDVITEDSRYKDFTKDQTKKIKEIFRSLGSNVEEFKNKSGHYELPINAAEMIRLYLTEDSGKGSYISKIKNRKFTDITLEEKTDFIMKAVEKLKGSHKEEEVEILKNSLLSQVAFSEDVKYEMLNAMQEICFVVEAAVLSVSAITGLDGLISVKSDKKLKHEIDVDDDCVEGNTQEYSRKNIPYDIKLSQTDRMELIKYLKEFIITHVQEWRKIVDISCELREDNSQEELDSEELIKQSIKEYENEIRDKLKPVPVVEHTPEEFKKILEELRIQTKNKQNKK